MKIQWTVTEEHNRVKFTGHAGLIRATYWNEGNGRNFPYEIYVRSGGRRKIILRVENNPKGPDLIDAKTRCEFLLASFDNNLSVDFLSIEEPRHNGTIYQPDNIPGAPKFYDVDGILIGRIYQHHAGEYYRVILITNRGVEKPGWTKTVCYRNILTGSEFSRPFDEFTPDRYTLIDVHSKMSAKTDFRRATILARNTKSKTSC